MGISGLCQDTALWKTKLKAWVEELHYSACFQNNVMISGNTGFYSIGGTLHSMSEEDCWGMDLGDILTGNKVVISAL